MEKRFLSQILFERFIQQHPLNSQNPLASWPYSISMNKVFFFYALYKMKRKGEATLRQAVGQN